MTVEKELEARRLIALMEADTAAANLENNRYGEWQTDHNGTISCIDQELSAILTPSETPVGEERITCEITAGEYPDRISIKPPAGTFEKGLVVMGAMIELVFHSTKANSSVLDGKEVDN